jgi:MFS family permease
VETDTVTKPSSTRASLRLQAGLSRWGLPDVRGRGWLLTAAVIDSAGSGLLYAFQIVYFATTTRLSLTEIGVALTIAQLLVLPIPALIGPLADRFGARALTVAGNIICGVGFVGYLVVKSPWQIVLVAGIVQFGVAIYWTAYSPLVTQVVAESERTRWFGLLHAGRNVGVGLGGGIAAFALAATGTASLRWLVVGNVMSYGVAAVLVARARNRGSARNPADAAQATQATATQATRPGGYADVLRDRAFMLLVAVNVIFVFAALVLNVLLAIYIVDALHGAAWIAGALLTLNTVLVGALQTVVTRWSESRRATRAITVAALLNALAFASFALLDVVPGWLVLPGLVLSLVVYTAAELVGSPAMSTLSVSLACAALRGRYQAVFQTSWTVGGALAPALFTTLLASGPIWPWVPLVALSLAAMPLARVLERRMPRRS